MKRAWRWIIFPLSLVVLVIGGTKLFDWLIWRGSLDYSRKTPAQIFQIVFDKPVPEGVRDIRVSARAYFIKHWCWMRIEGDTKAISTLLQDASAIPASEYPTTDPNARTDLNARDKANVGWDEIASIENPEYFRWDSYSRRKSVAWWSGYLIADKKRNLLFIVGQME